MKVLASGMEWFADNPGGLPRYFADYLSAWTASGDVARAFVRTDTKLVPSSRPSYVRALPLNSKNPLKVRRSWAQLYREELQQEQYDVFNPHFAYYAWAWPEMKSEIPVVTHFHGPWAYETLIEGQGRTKLQKTIEFRMQRWIEKSVYRRSDRFIVLSQFFRNVLVERYGVAEEAIEIIPGAVDMNRFCNPLQREDVRSALGISGDRFVLLTVRRLVRRMGLDNLIHAVDRLRKTYPELLLIMVGGGELYGELTQLIQEYHLEHHVRLTNRVPDDKLPMYYQAADLTVVPTLALEGFGFVTVESLASGTPVAGTPIGGTKEILQKFDARLLFDGTTVDDLVNGLDRLLSDVTHLPTREQTRQHAIEHYTWNAIIPQIKQVFEKAGERW